MSGRVLAAVVLSTLLHGSAAMAVLLGAPRGALLPALLIDLSQPSGEPAERPATDRAPGASGWHAPRASLTVRTPRPVRASAPEPPPLAPSPPPSLEAVAPPPAPPPAPSPVVSVSQPAPAQATAATKTAPPGDGAAAGPSMRRPGRPGGAGAVATAGATGPGPAGRAGQDLALALPGTSGGAAEAGAPAAEAGAPAAEYGRYLDQYRRRIQELLRYPAPARRRGLSGTVQLELTIGPAGAISQVTVVGSSSHPVLDDAAVETVRSLRPLPFPADLPPRILRVRLPVVFELR